MFPHYTKMRWLAQLASVRAVERAGNGDMDGAAKSILRIIKLNYSIKDEPILINTLVRISMVNMAGETLRAATEYGRLMMFKQSNWLVSLPE